MGIETMMIANRIRSRIGVPQFAANTDRDGNLLGAERTGGWKAQGMKLFGAQKRPAKIEGKTGERTIRSDLQATNFERIDARSIHTRNGGYRRAIAAARKHLDGCRAAICGFAEGKGKIFHWNPKFLLQQPLGISQFAFQFRRGQLVYHRMT